MFVDVYKANKRKQEVYLIYVDLYSICESEKCCGLEDETFVTGADGDVWRCAVVAVMNMYVIYMRG